MEASSEKQALNEPSPYEQACKYFRKASVCLQRARKPLQEDLYIPPSLFRASIQYVQETQMHIQKVIECLQNAPSLPLDIAKEQFRIIHELRIVDTTITQHLLPFLFQNRSGNFASISSYMHAIEEKLLHDILISLQETPHTNDIQEQALSVPDNKQVAQKENIGIVSQPPRTGIFISYSPKDKKSLDELRTHLSQYIRSGLVNAWDNTMVPPGAKLHDEINHAIQTAKVAILLVSADFLASDFIVKNELPSVLKAAGYEGTTILCVILQPCAFDDTELAQYKAVNAISNPLSNMSPTKRHAIWEQVAARVKDILQGK
jgi:TIR domain